MIYSVVWILLLVAFCIIEFLTFNLFTVWFICGSVIALILSLFQVPIAIQVVGFFIASFICLIFVQPFFNNIIKHEKTNFDSLIGQNCIVRESINNINETGAVYINGLVWTARSENDEFFNEGDIVKIKKIEGVKLIVFKEQSANVEVVKETNVN